MLAIAWYMRSAAEERALICANAYRNSGEGSSGDAAFGCAMKEMANRDTATMFVIIAAIIIAVGLYLAYQAHRSKS